MAANPIDAGMLPIPEDDRFERLMQRYAVLLRSQIALHCPRNLGLQVADIEQEARLRLWKAIREKELLDPASYIYRIAVSTTIDAVRRVLARREEALQGDAEGETPVASLVTDPAQSPEAQAERNQLRQAISAAVASLADNRRRAVSLHLQGLSLEEISILMSWSEGKARNLVYRGLKDLRQTLRRKGITVE